MKKVTILTAVAMLAAFGWASTAGAGGLFAVCSLSINDPGTADDVYTVAPNERGQDRTAATIMCGDMGKHNAGGMSVGAGDVLIPVSRINGRRSLRTGDPCIFWAKALNAPGTPNSFDEDETFHGACPSIEAD